MPPKPVFATFWDNYGPARVRVLGIGNKPGFLRISGGKEVRASSLKFEYGPDSEKFGLPYRDPYAAEGNYDIEDDMVGTAKVRREVFDVRRAVRELSAEHLGRTNLFEAPEDADKEAEEKETQEGDSLDTQVDRFLSEYESEAKSGPKAEGRHLTSLVAQLLREAGEDEEDDAEAEKPSDDEKEGDVEAPEKPSADQLDMNTFAGSVVRLIENYDSLLEVRNTILRRARNFLVKNYEETAAQKFDEVLQEEHGLEIGKSKQDQKDEFEAPRAGQAGPFGAGAGGGGGAA
jgi:hypothetical protein